MENLSLFVVVVAHSQRNSLGFGTLCVSRRLCLCSAPLDGDVIVLVDFPWGVSRAFAMLHVFRTTFPASTLGHFAKPYTMRYYVHGTYFLMLSKIVRSLVFCVALANVYQNERCMYFHQYLPIDFSSVCPPYFMPSLWTQNKKKTTR